MLAKIKNFFLKLIPTKRRLIQVYAALLYNANIRGFISGEIFTGSSKVLCVPGLNCYSCPGAIGACPLGSLQNALAESKTKWPTYVLGIILLYSIILGRTVCGFLCPIGLLQELLYKIKTPKLKKNRITRVLSYFKYVLLVALVIILPLVYGLQSKSLPLPAFCKYICPAGTFEGAILLLSNPNNSSFFGMLGSLFTWKFILLIIFIVASVFIFRFFCRFFCPLGAIYGLFNKLSIIGLKIDKDKCNSCGACVSHCKMDVKEVGDHECIMCGECKNVCKCHAISWKTISALIKEEEDNLEVESKNNNEVVKKVNKGRIVSIIASVIALGLLIFTLVKVNVTKNVYKVNDICNSVIVSLYDGSTFSIKEDNKSTLLCFVNDYDQVDYATFEEYVNEELNIIIISDFNNKDSNKNKIPSKQGFLFGYEQEGNSILNSFLMNTSYPYYVFLNNEDKILIKNDSISSSDYTDIIYPSILGKTVGNNVGDICINKEIGIVGSDDIFSVSKNRGKITVINFWYTTCTPCVLELPFFDQIYKEYSEQISVIAIHEGSMYHNDPTGVMNFINSQFSEYSITFGFDDENGTYYSVLGGRRTYPMTVIVDENGIITYVKQGSMTEPELRSQIESLLGRD